MHTPGQTKGSARSPVIRARCMMRHMLRHMWHSGIASWHYLRGPRFATGGEVPSGLPGPRPRDGMQPRQGCHRE